MIKNLVRGKVYVFIDGENVFYSQRTLGWKISYHKLWKNSLDIELALEMVELRDKFDTAILLSGDSDFAVVLDKLKKANKRVLVMSTRGHIARELLERAKFIDLRKLKSTISQ